MSLSMICGINFRSILQQTSCFIFVFAILPATIYQSLFARAKGEPVAAGRKAFERKHFRAALAFFRQAASESPESFEAQQWLGYMAAILGEGEEALGAYRKIGALRPSPVSSYWLGKVAGDIGETSTAVEALQKSLSSPETGRAFTQAQRYYIAQYLFRVLLELPDRNRALSFARRQGWFRQGVDFCTPPSSLEISSETAGFLALLIHPKRAECLLQLGKDLTENADYRLARFVLVELIRNSERAEIREKAESYIRHRLPSHDIAKRTEWLNGVATTLYTHFQLPDEALEVFRRTIAADAKFAQPYYRIGYIYWGKKKHEEALSWLHKALSIQPDHWRATYTLGRVLSDQKQYREAIIYYQKAVELNPDDAASYYNIGVAFSELGEFDQALPAYQKSVVLNPNDAYSRWGISWVLHKLGREEEAKREWAIAVKLNPELAMKNRDTSTSK
jgi:tetratricopeptide (TPR) repeat protein